MRTTGITWPQVQKWSFKHGIPTIYLTRGPRWVHHQPVNGYAYPSDPRLLGEVLLRGFAEGA